MDRAEMLRLADVVDEIAFENVAVLAERGGGTQWIDIASRCFAIADALRTRARGETA